MGIRGIINTFRQNQEEKKLHKLMDDHLVSAMEQYPALKIFPTLLDQYETDLESEHQYYVNNISTEKMALSNKCACLLAYLIETNKPSRILDTGSGYSSFICRKYSQAFQATVISVDDNQEWLEKTREYLESKDYDSEGNYYWKDFKEKFRNIAPEEKFDLIFHDLGSMETRKESLDFILSLAKKGSVVILDDMHKKHYRDFVEDYFRSHPTPYFHLGALLMDDHQRWSTLVCK